MRNPCSAACLAVALLMAAGCFEGTEVVTLNPDGSGKCVLDCFVTEQEMLGPGLPDRSPWLAARLLAKRVMASQGVEAWSDVSISSDSDGKLHFKGTAYFPSFNHCGLQNNVFKASWTADRAGGMALKIAMADAPEETGKPQPALTDAQIATQIKEARNEWRRDKPGLVAFEGKNKVEVTYLLPGQVEQAGVLERVPGGVRIALDSEKLLDKVDQWMNDDAALAAAVKAGQPLDVEDCDEATMVQVLFHQKGPIRAHVTGELKAQFDYKAEVAAARQAEPAMIKKLGLTGNLNSMPPLEAPITPATAPAP